MIQLMARARRLGREIAPIVGGDRAMQGHSPRDIDAGAREFLELAGGHNDGFIFTRAEWVRALGDFLDRTESKSINAKDAKVTKDAK